MRTTPGTTVVGEMTKVPGVIAKLPQIDHASAWRMFVDRARNSLGARARVVLKSLEGAIF